MKAVVFRSEHFIEEDLGRDCCGAGESNNEEGYSPLQGGESGSSREESYIALQDGESDPEGMVDGSWRARKPGKREENRPIRLSEQQYRVLVAINEGRSVFMTGAAGTGKSYLLELAIRLLRNKYGRKPVFVTASTGIAACALGGTTLHSFAGVGLGKGSKKSLAIMVNSRKEVKKRWRRAKALIIDEISMISGEFFDKLEYVARKVIEGGPFVETDDFSRVEKHEAWRGRAFGGVQLLVTGDFFQLPPINAENPNKIFAFEADCWKHCFDLQIELNYVFRQNDADFVSLLSEIRKGDCSAQTEARLRKCLPIAHRTKDCVPPTKLFPLRVDVDKVNQHELKALSKDMLQFTARDWAVDDSRRRLLNDVAAEKVLALCVGAQVMLVKNLDPFKGLVNGARGMVVGFVKEGPPADLEDLEKPDRDSQLQTISPTGEWPVVQFASIGQVRTMWPETWSVSVGDKEVASRMQVPLILAWALSVHKCQGMTLEHIETNLSRAFNCGMVYVALSRVRSLDGLHVTGFNPSKIKAHPAVKRFYEDLHAQKHIM